MQFLSILQDEVSVTSTKDCRQKLLRTRFLFLLVSRTVYSGPESSLPWFWLSWLCPNIQEGTSFCQPHSCGTHCNLLLLLTDHLPSKIPSCLHITLDTSCEMSITKTGLLVLSNILKCIKYFRGMEAFSDTMFTILVSTSKCLLKWIVNRRYGVDIQSRKRTGKALRTAAWEL